MGYLTELAAWYREWGLIAVELAGWQTRSVGDLDAAVVVSHHTAGGPAGRAGSLGTIVNGVSSVRGPLANTLQTRETDGPDQFIVVAAGKTNNAGTGGWAGFSGNSRTVGLEIEHTGRSVLPEARATLACRSQAAVLWGLGLDASRHCQHWEWNGQGGKIDVAEAPSGGSVDGDLWRRWTAEMLAEGPHGGSPPPPPGLLTPELEVPEMFRTYQEQASGDECALVISGDRLWFRRNAGGSWSEWAPIRFPGGDVVRVDPEGGISRTVGNDGVPFPYFLVLGVPESEEPTLVKVDLAQQPFGVPLAVVLA